MNQKNKFFIIIFAIFLIFIGKNCVAFERETHDFEGWSNDTKLNFVEPDWVWSADARINGLVSAYSGENVFYAHGGEVVITGMNMYIPVPTTTYGGISLWLRVWATSTTWDNKVSFVFGTGSWPPNNQFGITSNEWEGNLLEFEEPNGTTTIEFNVWENIKFDWLFTANQLKIRYKFGDNSYTDWANVPTNGTSTPTFFNILNIDNSAYNIWWDFFEIYDYNEAGTCNSGSGCIFCLTEEDCENQGCVWFYMPFYYQDFCYYSSAESSYNNQETSTIFSNFYNEFSYWGTPTEMIEKLASTTSPLFLMLSGILNNFNDRFNNTTAQQYGTDYGEAVPKLRGYADYLNDMLGFNLPIGEIALIYLTILVAIIIFRIVRLLIKIIPFS